MNFNNLDWRYIMDWVIVCSCFVLVVGVVIDIIKSIKEIHNLSDEHKILIQKNSMLSQEHRNIEDKVTATKSITENIISKESETHSVISNLDKIIYAEIQKNNIYQSNLTESQRDIKKHIEAVSSLMKEVERLQTLTKNQQEKIRFLEARVTQLQQQGNASPTQSTGFTQEF